jgi:hypothetical protein
MPAMKHAWLLAIAIALASCQTPEAPTTHPEPTEPKVSTAYLAGKTFRFSNSEKVLGEMTLAANGMISGYQHPNETRWWFDEREDRLLIYRADGSISAVYAQFEFSHGKLDISGEYRPANGLKHFLNEM